GFVAALVVVFIISVAMPHPDGLPGITSRLGHWMVAAQMWAESPWVGKGPFTFVDHYLRYLDRMTLPFGVPKEQRYIPWPHSLYLEQLAERGVIGAAAFALPMIVAWRRGTRRTRAAVVAFLAMGVMDLSLIKPWVISVYCGLVATAENA